MCLCLRLGYKSNGNGNGTWVHLGNVDWLYCSHLLVHNKCECSSVIVARYLRPYDEFELTTKSIRPHTRTLLTYVYTAYTERILYEYVSMYVCMYIVVLDTRATLAAFSSYTLHTAHYIVHTYSFLYSY